MSHPGAASDRVLQLRHLHPVLPGRDAGDHHEDRLGHAAHTRHYDRRVRQRCRQHLHRTGEIMTTFGQESCDETAVKNNSALSILVFLSGN